MKIYISASFVGQKRLRPFRDRLWAMGHQVVSSWLDETAPPADMSAPVFQKKLAIKDIAEIVAADLLIIDTFEPSTSGGRYVELGVALGRHQHCQIWMVGEDPNLFLRLADCWYENWEDLFRGMELDRGTTD